MFCDVVLLVCRLRVLPKTLDDLGDSLALLDKMQSEVEATEKKFSPLHEQFAILDKYEVAVPEQASSCIKESIILTHTHWDLISFIDCTTWLDH